MVVTRTLRNPATQFMLSALTVVAICAAIVRTQMFAKNPDVAAWGATFDLTLTIPFLYWLFVVRPGRARALTLAPVFVGCTMLAAFVIPKPQQFFLHNLSMIIGTPLEIVTMTLLARRVLRLRRRGIDSNDPYARILTATRELLGDTRVADFIACEIAILYYSLFCWRKKPVVPVNARSFTVHQRSGWSSIVVCFFVILVVESIGAHLLVQLWNPIAAWIVTMLDVYGILWLLGDYHALRLRPSLVLDDMLHVRYGLRWSVSVPLDAIESIDAIRGESDWKRKDVLKVAMIDEPRWLVRLREPVVARGLAGLTKTIRAIALLPDDDELPFTTLVENSAGTPAATLPHPPAAR